MPVQVKVTAILGLVILAGAILIGSLGQGDASSGAAGPSARTFVSTHRVVLRAAAGSVQAVGAFVQAYAASTSQGGPGGLQVLAERARNELGLVRSTLGASAGSGGGGLRSAELQLAAATSALDGAMGAFAGPETAPAPSRLARLDHTLGAAFAAWNAASGTIWRLAGESDPPRV